MSAMNEVKISDRQPQVYEWAADRVIQGLWESAHVAFPYPCSVYRDMDGIVDMGWQVEIEAAMHPIFIAAGVVAAFVDSQSKDGENGLIYDPLLAFGAAAIIGDVGIKGVCQKAEELLKAIGVNNDEVIDFGLILGEHFEASGIANQDKEDVGRHQFVCCIARAYFLDGVNYVLQIKNDDKRC